MSIKGLTGIRKELFNSWELIQKKCIWKNHQAYEGVPFEEGWDNFENFVKDNWIRYYRAKIKWRNYKNLTPVRKIRRGKTRKGKPKKTKVVRFTRKIKEEGFTKNNTVFTSPSDRMKYHSTTHKYMFEDKLLGTRDIKNILKKRGIDITMDNLVRRLRNNEDLFSPCIDRNHKYKGKYRSMVEIAELENVNYHVLKRQYYKLGTIKKALSYLKSNNH